MVTRRIRASRASPSGLRRSGLFCISMLGGELSRPLGGEREQGGVEKLGRKSHVRKDRKVENDQESQMGLRAILLQVQRRFWGKCTKRFQRQRKRSESVRNCGQTARGNGMGAEKSRQDTASTLYILGYAFVDPGSRLEESARPGSLSA
jgi:hypothetical protein